MLKCTILCLICYLIAIVRTSTLILYNLPVDCTLMHAITLLDCIKIIASVKPRLYARTI